MTDVSPSTQSTTAEQAHYLALKKQAEDKVLLVSPPYHDEGARTAFLSGYEAALRDIAKGWLVFR